MRKFLEDISFSDWLKQHKYLLVFFILFGFAVSIQREIIKPEMFSIDSENVESELHKLEQRLDDLIADTEQKYIDGKFHEQDSIRTWLIDEDYSDIAQKGFTILVYKNDSLLFWSDNHVPVTFYYSDSGFDKNRMLMLGNGWFEVKTKAIRDGVIVGLLRIKNSYSYENKYLKNAFRSDLKIPSSVKISKDFSTYGKIIQDKDGNNIFSLVPVSKVVPIQEHAGWISLLYFLSFGFLLLYFNSLFLQISDKKHSEWYLLLFGILILAARYAMIKFKFPFFVYSLLFFEPEIYTGNWAAPYLGDFLFNAMLSLFFAVNIFRIIPLERILSYFSEKSKKVNYILAGLLLFITALFLAHISNLIFDLIQNSNIEFRIHLITKLNLFSISAYFITALLLSAFIYFADRFILAFSLFVDFKTFVYVFLISNLPVALYYYLVAPEDIIYLLPVYFSSIFIVAGTRFLKSDYRFYTFSILVFIFSIFIIGLIYKNVELNQREESRVLIYQLEDERDVVAESLLSDIFKRIEEDKMLKRILTNVIVDHKYKIHDYLQRKYFYGFWEKYKLTTTLCGNSIYYPTSNQATPCENYFMTNVAEFGHKIENSDFYFIGNRDGTITYFGKYTVPQAANPEMITVYIQLTEKLTDMKLGYPDLLIDEANLDRSLFKDYSYAKYRKGKLVAKSGEYPFDLSDNVFQNHDSDFLIKDGYVHHIQKFEPSNLIVLSRPQVKPFDYLTAFAYLFVFLNLALLLSILIANPGFLIKKFKPDFNNRIRFSMLFILLLTFLFFTAGTIYYAVSQHKENQKAALSEKMQSVITELKHKLNDQDRLTPDWHDEGYDHLDELLIKFSQIFFVDINIYELNGNLLGTSRNEIFERGLIGKQMNREAYNELVLSQKALIIKKEQIGELSYSSVYIPFENKDNKIIAYVNLPYFTDDDGLQKNLSNLLITTINIYVILFLVSLVIAFFISTNITRPLRMLQNKFKNIELGKKQQIINYDKDDEIGALVAEYNRMVTELENSVKQLADKEREDAWREMAKQIAHEIKNPLTPMKLSMQLLQRSWNDGSEDFDKRLNNVSQTVIEQIDTLSSIASEFSAFAKMPKPQDEEVDIVAKIKTVVQLFETTKDVDIKLDLHNNSDIYILADKEQLSRVFINIIKNGIQSIPEGVKGQMYVDLITYGNYVKITIEDNGSGIDEDKRGQLFKPSFTTKTTGMGMGLAIVKNIINNANGEIWFESEVGKGTKFFVEFPIIEKSE